ncbi:CxxH/CxxC protein [Dethiobacter alkaliphilus]|uniref:CxxH/CxxC protein n=1 Tax=Dethiobacter alkaliphilus TaxID=427926 RepID=UPI0022269274|nr:CxxH/CxxC protein [Dethiobacter alkaliphilus]MCW3488937.1 CxxH/CxxC protein [Dethiobacter alkaliphilus]
MYAVCAEHVEQAIDLYVDEYELSPDLHRLEEYQKEKKVPDHCLYCSLPPVYLLT